MYTRALGPTHNSYAIFAPSLPLPQQPTETAVPWKILTDAGIEVLFATEHGTQAACDPLMLTGVMFGQMGAEKEAIEFYNEMIRSDNFKNPLKWSEMRFMDYEGLLLPGGHAKGVRQYLESEEIRRQVIEFFPHTVEGGSKVCASICHGPIVLARAVDPSTGKSVLHDRKTTALPHYLEQCVFLIFLSHCSLSSGSLDSLPFFWNYKVLIEIRHFQSRVLYLSLEGG